MNTTALPHRRVGTAGLATALACAILLLVALSACSTSGARSGGSSGYISGAGVVNVIDTADRKAAPDVSGDALGGGKVSLADARGSVVVLNVWAAWCPPCRAEADDLVEAAKQLPDVTFVGINVRDKTAQAQAFVREKKIPYPSLEDTDGSAMLALHLTSLPSTVVLDPEGRIAVVVSGPVTVRTLVGLVDDLGSES